MSLKRIEISATVALCAFVATTTAFALQKGAHPESEPYHPAIDPASFSTDVNNPYFTLAPGTTFTYKGKSSEGAEVNKVTVTDRTRKVMGVTTRVVWDRVWLNDRLIEETYDWYAQDKVGNVWYFGEDSREIAKGKVVSTKGSWEAGVKGAQPGIVMQADPRPGKPYRQEYLKGEAEDMAQVLSVHATARVPAGSFDDCLKTRDWSAIEAGSTEHKYYSRKIGAVVLETEHGDTKRVELVEVTRASAKKSENK